MNKCESAKISALMSVLINKPLCSISRTATTAYLGFGDLLDMQECILNNKGNLRTSEKTNHYALCIQTAFRFKCGNKIILGQADIFQPKAHDFSSPDCDLSIYDYDSLGKNHFDELSPQFSIGNDKGFVVKAAGFEPDTPETQNLPHPRAFSVLPYESMPSPEKHPTARNPLRFRCVQFRKHGFSSRQDENRRNTFVFREFLTQYWRKYGFQNRIGFDSRRLKHQKVFKEFYGRE